MEQKNVVIATDGRIIEKAKGDLQGVLTVSNRERAIEIAENLNKQIAQFCVRYDTGIETSRISIEWKRVRKPSHLFTKEEMYKLYKNADDRKGNKLVIDEEGYARMIPADADGTLYPVCHETFCARRNNIGKYSPLLTFEDDYKESLCAWLQHLQLCVYVYCDGSMIPSESEEALRERILQYY